MAWSTFSHGCLPRLSNHKDAQPALCYPCGAVVQQNYLLYVPNCFFNGHQGLLSVDGVCQSHIYIYIYSTHNTTLSLNGYFYLLWLPIGPSLPIPPPSACLCILYRHNLMYYKMCCFINSSHIQPLKLCVTIIMYMCIYVN